jgi:hypothetical protein
VESGYLLCNTPVDWVRELGAEEKEIDKIFEEEERKYLLRRG